MYRFLPTSLVNYRNCRLTFASGVVVAILMRDGRP
jgi:hypothetical protein